MKATVRRKFTLHFREKNSYNLRILLIPLKNRQNSWKIKILN